MSGWIVLKRDSRGISHWVAKLGEEWIDKMSLLSLLAIFCVAVAMCANAKAISLAYRRPTSVSPDYSRRRAAYQEGGGCSASP